MKNKQNTDNKGTRRKNTPIVLQILEIIEQQSVIIQQQAEVIQQLKYKIALLKNQKLKHKIRSSELTLMMPEPAMMERTAPVRIIVMNYSLCFISQTANAGST